jgi:hypothetical protein
MRRREESCKKSLSKGDWRSNEGKRRRRECGWRNWTRKGKR